MGYFVGVPSTGFVGTGEMAAVTSFMPCHIFGDQMLIGTGIRVGFYLLYAAAIIALLFSVDKQFRFWHGAWGILALSLFLAMFLNVVDYNLIIIDYAVLIHLVLWYPVFFVFTVLFRQALVVKDKIHVKGDAEYRERLQRCRRSAVADLDVRRARAYADVLRAFALYAAAEEAERDHDAARAALGQAVQHYVSHWHEQIEIDDEHGRRSEEVHADGGAVTTVYNTELIDEITAAPTRADIDKLRDLYIAALVHSHHSVAEARAAEQEVARIASEELRIRRRPRPAVQSLRHFLLATSYKDQLTAALGLLIWSAFMFGTAALNWPLLHHGGKPGGACDNVPTVYFVFAPKKPFADAGFATFLRVWTVGVCLVAVLTTAAALYLITVTVLGPAAVGLSPRRRRKAAASPTTDPKPSPSLEAGPDASPPGSPPPPTNLRTAPGYSPRARAHHTQSILLCLSATEPRSIPHRYHDPSSRRAVTTARFTRQSLPWALLLAILLAVAAACAELTVSRQGARNDVPLDFARPPLRETAEIMAFLVGLYALVLVLLSVVGGLVGGWRGRRVEEGKRKGKDSGKEKAGEEARVGVAY